MIEFKSPMGSPSKLADEVESWIRSLPSIDPGETLERVGTGVADLVPRRRRSRGWTAFAVPAVMAALAVLIGATMWLLARRAPTADRFGLETMVPDTTDFDRDAGLRAATEGMAAPDRTGAPADDADLGAR